MELVALLFGEDFVDADLGGVHLARYFGLNLGGAVEEGVEVFGLVAFAVHVEGYAVVDGLLASA